MNRRRVTVPAVRWLVTVFAVAVAGLGAPSIAAPSDDGQAGVTAQVQLPMQSHGVRVDRRATIAARFPSEVTVGERIRVVGIAALGSGTKRVRRPVRLVERVGRRWVVRHEVRTTRTGGFALTARAGSRVRTRTFRAFAPRFRGLAATATPPRRVRVVAEPPLPPPPVEAEPPGEAEPTPYPPLGSPDDWSFLSAGGSRWDPCTEIGWRYNPTGERYPTALDDVHEAIRRIADRTGLDFRYLGTTDHVPMTGAPRPGTADFYVAWADQEQVPDLAGSTVGIGGGWQRSIAGWDVAHQFISGYLVLDRAHGLRPGHDVAGTPTWGQVIDHEVLHGLGLGHAVGREQVMHGAVSQLNHRFGAGDLTGMTRIGASRGCLS